MKTQYPKRETERQIGAVEIGFEVFNTVCLEVSNLFGLKIDQNKQLNQNTCSGPSCTVKTQQNFLDRSSLKRFQLNVLTEISLRSMLITRPYNSNDYSKQNHKQ